MKKQFLIQGAISLVLALFGLGCIFFPTSEAGILYWALVVIIGIFSLVMIHTAWHQRTTVNIGVAAGTLLLAVCMIVFAKKRADLICVGFGVYLFLISAIMFIQWILDIKDKSRFTRQDGISTAYYLIWSVLVFVYRRNDLRLVMAFLGVYILLQSVQSLLQIFCFLHPSLHKEPDWELWIPLPVIFASVLPGMYLRWMLKTKYREHPKTWDERKNDDEVNFRVWIHTGTSGEHLVGHMTFSYKGLMYSYGDYDRLAEKWWHTMGPGILFTVDAERYINNCCIYEEDTIFEYGLHLDEEQIELLEAEIKKTFDNLYVWECRLQQEGPTPENFKKWEHVYADRLWYRTDCVFHKFHKGAWKTYFILDNNCSTFSADFLSKIGCHIPDRTGITSPGEYWQFFETLYEDPSSIVITRSWHDGKLPETLFDVKQLRTK